MNDQSEKHTAPLDDSHELFNFNGETAIVPEGAKLVRRILKQAEESEDENTVTDEQSVRLVVRGMSEVVHFENNKAVLGRTDHRKASHPQVDLTHFGAAERGVSRQHARLEIRDKRLLITDLDSSNGTYLRGKRIPAYTPVRIHVGDEVMLGRLAVKVLFE
jgi:hypothetical protein